MFSRRLEYKVSEMEKDEASWAEPDHGLLQV